MAEAKWIKIVTDIFDDEKILLIEELPDADSIIVIWFKLLCLAGKQNNCGVFLINDKIPYTEKMLATIFRRKEATVRLALETFESFGMIEIIDNVITIPNWGKHQTLDKLEKKTEYMRDYMRDYRKKQKQIACKTNDESNSNSNVSSADIDIYKDIELEEDKEDIYIAQNDAFDAFWKHYPKKVDKQRARVAFKKVISKNKITVDELIAAVERHKRSRQWQDMAYIPNPTTWLNGSRWEDILPEATAITKNGATSGKKAILDSLRQKYAKEEGLIE